MQKQDSVSHKLERVTKEAEILSRMEESNKTKEWIKRQIKKKITQNPSKTFNE
jgi:hypothetical protein